MKKPELLVTPQSVTHLEQLFAAGADAAVIGDSFFGLRLAGDFTRNQVEQATRLAHVQNKKVYVAMNAIFHNDKINELNEYIQFLDQIKVDAIIFGDPAILIGIRETAANIPLHWNTETTATNFFTCNYWGEKGAKRALLARELNIDEVLEVKAHALVEIEIQVHGMTCMFQSKRNLIDNYQKFLGRPLEHIRNSRTAYLYDVERDASYPIFQDQNGTHIMSPKDICMIEELAEFIEAGIDSFKIDGILHTAEYHIAVTKLYRQAIDLAVESPGEYQQQKKSLFQQIVAIQPENRYLDTGFYFKESVY